MESQKGMSGMTRVQIRLQNMQRAQELAQFVTPMKGDFFLVSGTAVANAKSLIGILALNLNEYIELRIIGCSEEDEQKLMAKLRADYDAQ
jgi:phosphotransferase system HPr-like phosphotransfer protein